jgi:hypothetical protein
MLAAAAAATVGVLGVTATLSAAWIVNRSMASNPRIYSTAPIGPASLALVPRETGRAREADAAFAAKWAQTASLMSLTPRAVDVPESPVNRAIARAIVVPPPARIEVARLTPPIMRAPERSTVVPLPRPHPAQRQLVEEPAPKLAAPRPVAPKLAAIAPPRAQMPVVEKPVVEAHNRAPVLSDTDRRTALYDIAAHTVYMPNGQKLEAHSGLYDKMDDPRFIKVRMRGPTPPNVYDLTLREQLFHGVRAIRLNPVDEGRMYGRDGMLAHTYMLGPNGQSNGCVSFKDYQKFLTAFLNGEVDRLVVVPALGKTPWRTAVAEHGHVRRYAVNN